MYCNVHCNSETLLGSYFNWVTADGKEIIIFFKFTVVFVGAWENMDELSAREGDEIVASS